MLAIRRICHAILGIGVVKGYPAGACRIGSKSQILVPRITMQIQRCNTCHIRIRHAILGIGVVKGYGADASTCLLCRSDQAWWSKCSKGRGYKNRFPLSSDV
ncbi:hypothetical protein BDZ45DRAFT_357401 [Acephala macrosclerotiorum]|nr:hypothetical protein BDZ45DRAFT_357401 [Acephala macrosclerotiorum]